MMDGTYSTGMEYCSDFLHNVGKFGWFISRHFGDARLDKMTALARAGKADALHREMESVWFALHY